MVHAAAVDHNVHAHGLSHPLTTEALKADDRLLRRMIAALDDDTLLLVTSDHGLMETGHGGASDEELASLVFIYRKSGLLRSQDFFLKFAPEELAADQIDNFDFTPTLSLLLKKSPPLNAIGDFIPEAFPLQSELNSLQSAMLLVRCRLEILKQKQELLENFDTKQDPEANQLKAGIEAQISKTESVLKNLQQYENKPQFSSLDIQGEEERLKKLSELFADMRKAIMNFKKYSTTRAVVHDSKSALITLVASSISLVALIATFILKFQNRPQTKAFASDIKLSFIAIALGVLCFWIFDSNLVSSIFLGWSVILLIYFLGDLGDYSWSPATILIYFAKGLTRFMVASRDGFLLIVPYIFFRLVDNSNILLRDHPFQTLMLAKCVLDYGLVTFMLVLGGHPIKSRLKVLWDRLMFIFIEGSLLILLSFGDVGFILKNKAELEESLVIFVEHEFMIGTLVPGAILGLIFAYQSVKCYKFSHSTLGLFLTTLLPSLISVRFAQENVLWGRQVIPCLVLALTCFAFNHNFKTNKDKIPSKHARFVLLTITLMPLVLLIGGNYSSFIALVILCLLYLTWKQTDLTAYMILNTAYLLRMAFFAGGNRIRMSHMSLKAGTLFYNDYHWFSWLTVTIKTVYPCLLGLLFAYLLASRLSPASCKSNCDLKGWLILAALDIGTAADFMGTSISFISDRDTFMIDHATSSLVYESQLIGLQWIARLTLQLL